MLAERLREEWAELMEPIKDAAHQMCVWHAYKIYTKFKPIMHLLTMMPPTHENIK